MRLSICKKSVFGILFLFLFLFGTICGVLLFRCLSVTAPQWLSAYCDALSVSEAPHLLLQLLFSLWPLLAVLAVGLLPYAQRLLPVLIVLRGCLLSYSAAAFYATGHSGRFILRDLIFLPLFYGLCYCFYKKQFFR